MKIKDVLWYTPLTHAQLVIGIVLVDTGFGHKAYIGVGTGINEEVDKALIAVNGAPFRHGDALWPLIEDWIH